MDPSVYELRREQWIAHPLEEVFAFFSRAENLERLTPRWLRFEILTPGPIELRQGSHIRYRIRWNGLPMSWHTEITEWNPPFGFTDVQLRGPYREWRHEHSFEADAGGTRMRDTVSYRVPFGFAGRLFHRVSIRRDLEHLFDYRAAEIAALFGG